MSLVRAHKLGGFNVGCRLESFGNVRCHPRNKNVSVGLKSEVEHGRPQHIRYLRISVGSVSPKIGPKDRQFSHRLPISVGPLIPNHTLIDSADKRMLR